MEELFGVACHHCVSWGLGSKARAEPREFCPQHKALATFLTANLPPTLAKSQVSSVRKNLKLHLLSVLKHPASLEFQAQITTLLVDLGTPQAEIARNMPSSKDARKRPRDDSDSTLKKMKLGKLWSQVRPGRRRWQGLTIFEFCTGNRKLNLHYKLHCVGVSAVARWVKDLALFLW